MENEQKNEIIMVTVLTATYNHESYIRQCLDGIVMQKTNFRFEAVVHDDASTDKTADIIREYEAKYPDIIKPIYQKTNGFGSERNAKAKQDATRGKYIAFCEGDDYWTDPLKLQKQVDFLENHNDYAGYAHQSLIIANNQEPRLFKDGVPQNIGVNDILGGRLFHTASVLFRSDVLKLYSNAPLVLSGDRFVNLCIAICGKIYYSEDCMCVYRIISSGLSTNVSVKQMSLDLNAIPYIKSIYPPFPKYRYLSYIYATMGLCKNASVHERLYYLLKSFILSFSYFPKNIGNMFNYLARKI
jgi:glycosyltransferase involved in cell wall biosynthesis